MNPEIHRPDPRELTAAIRSRQESIRTKHSEIAKAAESVIQITPCKNGRILGIGTGVVINSKHILTAAHVVHEADDIVFYMNAGGYKISTTPDNWDFVVDQNLDIALLPLPEVFQDLVPALPLGSTAKLRKSNFFIGFPALNQNMEWSLGRDATIHRVANIIRNNSDTLLCARVSDPHVEDGAGSSGGPLVDQFGRILGIIQKGASMEHSEVIRSTYLYALPSEIITSTFQCELTG